MCGIVGFIGNKPVSHLIYHGLFAIQHRGQSSAGKLTYDGNIHVTKDSGLVRDIFNDEKTRTVEARSILMGASTRLKFCMGDAAFVDPGL